ncbi:MAG: MAPEG family protein, partial [Candidatus Binatia bacterium]|nr:MAPEG family protein [Candidatus Binatia bacterium]
MEPFLGDPAFRTFAVCTAILVLKMLGVSFYTAIQRRTSSGYTNPEDTAFADEGVEASEVENAGVARALRIHRNDMESIPLFFAIGLVY